MKDERGRTDENLARTWFASRYHSPMAQLARVGFLAGLSAAHRPERPRWNPGDFFERRPDLAR